MHGEVISFQKMTRKGYNSFNLYLIEIASRFRNSDFYNHNWVLYNIFNSGLIEGH